MGHYKGEIKFVRYRFLYMTASMYGMLLFASYTGVLISRMTTVESTVHIEVMKDCLMLLYRAGIFQSVHDVAKYGYKLHVDEESADAAYLNEIAPELFEEAVAEQRYTFEDHYTRQRRKFERSEKPNCANYNAPIRKMGNN